MCHVYKRTMVSSNDFSRKGFSWNYDHVKKELTLCKASECTTNHHFLSGISKSGNYWDFRVENSKRKLDLVRKVYTGGESWPTEVSKSFEFPPGSLDPDVQMYISTGKFYRIYNPYINKYLGYNDGELVFLNEDYYLYSFDREPVEINWRYTGYGFEVYGHNVFLAIEDGVLKFTDVYENQGTVKFMLRGDDTVEFFVNNDKIFVENGNPEIVPEEDYGIPPESMVWTVHESPCGGYYSGKCPGDGKCVQGGSVGTRNYFYCLGPCSENEPQGYCEEPEEYCVRNSNGVFECTKDQGKNSDWWKWLLLVFVIIVFIIIIVVIFWAATKSPNKKKETNSNSEEIESFKY